tara:strand:- start:538 stop:741 length:204 start_codon:yes stop_codon:yes gene_type:complete
MERKKMDNINEDQFNAYEEVRQSGMTNMFDVPAVIKLAGGVLNKEEVHTIMDNYTKLYNKFVYPNRI